MPQPHDLLFRTLADPTRRAIFERLCREGDQTVRRPDRRGRGLAAGRLEASRACSSRPGWCATATRVARRITARSSARWPAGRLDERDGRLLAEPLRPPRRPAQEDGPMTETATETRSVVVEREIPYPPEKIWRALTQPHLIEEWLMKNDFKPVVGHRFNLSADWGAVDCRGPDGRAEQDAVLLVGRPRTSRASSPGRSPRRARAPACAWSRPASGRTRSPTYRGAKVGWPRFLAALEQVLARMD